MKINESNDHNESAIELLNKDEINNKGEEEVLTDKYHELLESVNLEGKYQKIQFIVDILISFSCTMIIIILPLQKVIPKFMCFNQADFFNDENAFSMYKNNKQFDINLNEECIKEYCKPITTNYEDAILLVLVIDNFSEINWITQLGELCSFTSFFISASFACFTARVIIPTCIVYIADNYGRLPVFRLCLISLLITFILFYYSTNSMLTIICCFTSAGFYYIYNLHGFMGSEYMSKSWGKSLIAFSAASYSLSGIIYIAVMYYYHNWNILLIINIFIIIILIIISYTIQKETPRFF